MFALQQWRVMVLGRPLVIITDHKVLSFIMDCPLKSPRMSRWTLFMHEFNFEIEYCAGCDNIVADSLSRNPYLTPVLHKPDYNNTVEVFELRLTSEFKNIRGKF